MSPEATPDLPRKFTESTLTMWGGELPRPEAFRVGLSNHRNRILFDVCRPTERLSYKNATTIIDLNSATAEDAPDTLPIHASEGGLTVVDDIALIRKILSRVLSQEDLKAFCMNQWGMRHEVDISSSDPLSEGGSYMRSRKTEKCANLLRGIQQALKVHLKGTGIILESTNQSEQARKELAARLAALPPEPPRRIISRGEDERRQWEHRLEDEDLRRFSGAPTPSLDLEYY